MRSLQGAWTPLRVPERLEHCGDCLWDEVGDGLRRDLPDCLGWQDWVARCRGGLILANPHERQRAGHPHPNAENPKIRQILILTNSLRRFRHEHRNLAGRAFLVFRVGREGRHRQIP